MFSIHFMLYHGSLDYIVDSFILACDFANWERMDTSGLVGKEYPAIISSPDLTGTFFV